MKEEIEEIRFKGIFAQAKGLGRSHMRIIVDTETGVNYLNICSEYGEGLTPLLDENGKIVISKDIKD